MAETADIPMYRLDTAKVIDPQNDMVTLQNIEAAMKYADLNGAMLVIEDFDHLIQDRDPAFAPRLAQAFREQTGVVILTSINALSTSKRGEAKLREQVDDQIQLSQPTAPDRKKLWEKGFEKQGKPLGSEFEKAIGTMAALNMNAVQIKRAIEQAAEVAMSQDRDVSIEDVEDAINDQISGKITLPRPSETAS